MIILACGILFGISIFLLLESSLIQRAFGLVLLSSAVNLIILVCGRLHFVQPAFIYGKIAHMANPLPQALILTAIVIGFGLFALLCALLKRLLS